MKKDLVCFISCLILLVSCKKDPAVAGLNSAGKRMRFADTVSVTGGEADQLSVANSRLKNNFYFISKNTNGTFGLTACDDEMNISYAKSIDVGSGNLVDAIGSRASDDFYTLSASFNFTVVQSYEYGINAYVLQYHEPDTLSPCNPQAVATNYHYNAQFLRKPVINGSNNSVVKRFDEHGNERWSKTLDGNSFNGNALETDSEGNLYVLTASSNQSTQHYNYQLSNVVPYFYEDIDSCSFSLYKFDFGGNMIFKQTISNLEGEYGSGFHPNLAVSSEAIYVAGTRFFFTFDRYGKLLSNQKPVVDRCNNKNSGLISRPDIKNAIVQTEIRYTPVSVDDFFLKLDLTAPNSVLKDKPLDPFLAVDSLENTYTGTQHFLTKIAPSGQQVYYKNFNSFAYSNIASGLVDKHNVFYSFGIAGNKVIVYKYDEQGDFK